MVDYLLNFILIYSPKNMAQHEIEGFMDKHEIIEIIVKEITEEAVNFKNAENPSEELEALKDMLDVLMRGTTQVVEKIDQYNDRRYR